MVPHVVVGVGNIYANEALFAAGIHPTRHAGRISLARYQALNEAIRTILAHAIEQGGTTLKDFVGSSGQAGYFKQELNVYRQTLLSFEKALRGFKACVDADLVIDNPAGIDPTVADIRLKGW